LRKRKTTLQGEKKGANMGKGGAPSSEREKVMLYNTISKTAKEGKQPLIFKEKKVKKLCGLRSNVKGKEGLYPGGEL